MYLLIHFAEDVAFTHACMRKVDLTDKDYANFRANLYVIFKVKHVIISEIAVMST